MSDNVVDLDRKRDELFSPLDQLERALPPGRPKEQIEQILSRQDAEEYLQSLNPHVFYRLIKRAGWDQSYDLVQYASPQQIQNFIDFDCWIRDRLISDKLQKWLAALVTESTDEHLTEVCRDLDPEVLAYYFKDNLKVEPVEEGRIPDHMEGNVAMSPDNQYAIVYPDDEDTASLLRMLIDRLYGADRMLGWTLIEAVRWELPSELEEYAYKWRKSRLEQFGFVPREEAIEIYQYIDPSKYRDKLAKGKHQNYVDLEAPETLDPPVLVEEELDEEFYIAEVLGQLEDPEQIQKAIHEVTSVIHRAFMADGIEPGDIESGRQVVRRTFGYMSLGLEFLSRSDLDRAVELIQKIPFKRTIQVGFSLTRELQKKFRKLEDSPTLTLIEDTDYSLLSDDERALAEALGRERPTYASGATAFDIFKTQDQLDDAAQRIGLLAFKQLWLFTVAADSIDELAQKIYGEETTNTPTAVTFDVLFQTYLTNLLTENGGNFTPVTQKKLSELQEILDDKPWGESPADFFDTLLGDVVEQLPGDVSSLLTQWLEPTLERMTSEFAGLEDSPESKFLEDLFLVAGTEQ